ncbi:MAG: GAF domain-containing protein [Anaerolineae bacterium]|nr:GAF domain-containing protein [Anaerolineae bacterium]
MDVAQIETNITLEQTLRRANLLAAATEVSQNITQILDIDELLPRTVDIICEAYGFYYAGIFLVDRAGEFAVLRAGRGEPGRIMIDNNHKLAVGGNSMIGACTALNKARISLDVDTEKVWYPNPVLPATRSEMALPLAIGDRVIGAVSVQSVESAAFTDEDISSLQAMANQLAIAIDNAYQRRELEEAHSELLRVKTYEAIATATGDAIHWIGNKAEPIEGAVQRIEDDTELLLCALAAVLNQANSLAEVKQHPLIQTIQAQVAAIAQAHPQRHEAAAALNRLPAAQVSQRLSLESIFEDLHIIGLAGRMIMQVKEDLIGPAREQAPRPTMMDDVVKDALSNVSVPAHITVKVDIRGSLSLVLADPLQLNRVFVNLLQNAVEALVDHPNPQIDIFIRPDRNGDFMLVDVKDNGAGIAESDMEKIWITFHTTKGIKGHTGLGLPACRLVLEQMGGRISATSQQDYGSTFTVSIPVYKAKEPLVRYETARERILLIDDNDRWRQFAHTALEGNGYRVTLSNGLLRHENLKKYDLILIDDILSEANSAEIMQVIHREGAIKKTIAVSSTPRVERAKACKLLGVHNLLPKPYTRVGLLTEVYQALYTMRRSN